MRKSLDTPEEQGAYRSWAKMKERCNNPKHSVYKYYGGRGISYISSWESFDSFFRDLGPRPLGMELSRRNDNADYSKKNCQWDTTSNNVRNSSWTKLLVGEVKIIRGLYVAGFTPTGLAEKFGVSRSCIKHILSRRTWKDI